MFSQDFPEGMRRREALEFKIRTFLASRVAVAQLWDIALLRLVVSNSEEWQPHENEHSVYCWHVARDAHCQCLHGSSYFLHLNVYQTFFRDCTIPFNTLMPVGDNDIAQRSLVMLRFILSLKEAGELAVFFSLCVHFSLAS